MTLRKLMVASVAATAVGAPMHAMAESNTSIASPGSASASANVDFQVIIPSFLFFQIGSPGNIIDLMTFDLETAPGIEPGTGTAVAGSGNNNGGSDQLTVTIRTNASNVTINASGGSMSSPTATDLIPLTDITVTPGGLIPVPAFGASTGFPTLGASLIVDTWTFSYNNDNIYEAGTYGGAANGGRVQYTATDL